MKNKSIHYLIFGNPGAGKSTLGNRIAGKLVFKSGPCLVTGLTQTIQIEEFEDGYIVDCPGLSDISNRENAAKEIEKSLKMNKPYKIFFVLTLSSGRVNIEDINTINSIIEAVKTEFNFGVILNKITPPLKEIILKSPSNLLACYQTLKKKPAATIIIKKFNYLDDESNVLLRDDHTQAELKEFLNNIPISVIDSKYVDRIDVKDYEKKIRDLGLEIEKLTKQLENGMRISTMPLEKPKNVQNETSQVKEDQKKFEIYTQSNIEKYLYIITKLLLEDRQKPPVILERFVCSLQ